MNKKIKIAIFIATVILTMGGLHAAKHGKNCEMNIQQHCIFMDNHHSEKKLDCNLKCEKNVSNDTKKLESKKDTVK